MVERRKGEAVFAYLKARFGGEEAAYLYFLRKWLKRSPEFRKFERNVAPTLIDAALQHAYISCSHLISTDPARALSEGVGKAALFLGAAIEASSTFQSVPSRSSHAEAPTPAAVSRTASNFAQANGESENDILRTILRSLDEQPTSEGRPNVQHPAPPSRTASALNLKQATGESENDILRTILRSYDEWPLSRKPYADQPDLSETEIMRFQELHPNWGRTDIRAQSPAWIRSLI